MKKKILFSLLTVFMLCIGMVSAECTNVKEIALGEILAEPEGFGSTLDLWVGEISFQGEEYTNTYEELYLGSDPTMVTSLISSEDEYESNVYMEINAKDSIKVAYKFSEKIDMTQASSTEPLTIEFLRTTFEITSIDSDTSFTAYVSEEHYLQVDESVEIEGKTVTLIDVSSTSTVIEVDGVSEIINVDSTETVNGLEITVDDTFSRTEKAESSANLIIGEEASESYTDGDAYIGEDGNDPNWVWNLADLTSKSVNQVFEIENDFVMNDFVDNPPSIGECFSLPNDYVEFCFDSLTVAEKDYTTYEFEFDSSADLSDSIEGLSSVPAIHLHTDDESIVLEPYTTSSRHIVEANSTVKTDEVWFYTPEGSGVLADGTSSGTAKWVGMFYKDSSTNKVKLFGYFASDVVYSNVILDIQPLTTSYILKTWATYGTKMGFTLDDEIIMNWGLDVAEGVFDSLGETRSLEEVTDLMWESYYIGTKDEDHRTTSGIIIKNPKDRGAADTVEFSIPSEQVFAKVSLTTSRGCDEKRWLEIPIYEEEVECYADPDCSEGFVCSTNICVKEVVEEELSGSDCNDGIDNDGDGRIDALGACQTKKGIHSCSEKFDSIRKCKEFCQTNFGEDAFIRSDKECGKDPNGFESVTKKIPKFLAPETGGSSLWWIGLIIGLVIVAGGIYWYTKNKK